MMIIVDAKELATATRVMTGLPSEDVDGVALKDAVDDAAAADAAAGMIMRYNEFISTSSDGDFSPDA
jgi:hypothetical protein